MKRAAVCFFLFLAVPAVVLADGVTRRMIVATRRPAPDALQRLRGDDFDPSNRIRYNVQAFKYVNAFVADLDESEIAALKRSPEVDYIEEDSERHAFADTIKPGQQTVAYGLNLVQAPQTWPITRGRSINATKPIRVAIIDSGIDYTAAELAPNYQGGINIAYNTNDPFDDAGHGTHVAGIIAAADNGAGVVGVAPQVEIYSAKVLDSCGSGRTSDIITALEWVRDQKKTIGGNWIVNLSLGARTSNNTERIAFQAAADDGLLIFAASGNDFPAQSGLSFPAGYPSVVSVGAIDSTSTVAGFSQRGSALKVVAPGVEVLSTWIGAQLKTDDGRAFAATLPLLSNAAGDDICPPSPVLTGPVVFCGFGGTATDFPAAVAGKVALISRGNVQGAGSVATKSGSTQVTGTGTSFVNDIHAGDSITICGQGSLTVASVTNNTTLTHSGSTPATITASGLPYVVGLNFSTKARNAKAAGATGVIVYNHDSCGATPTDITPSLVVTSATEIPPFIFISENDGLSLRGTPNATINIAFDDHRFALASGTSMASPHAAGVAALAWSVAPLLRNTEIADAMEQTAVDLGDAGTDNTYGFGLINAKAVVDRVNTGSPAQPAAPTGRPPGRRGH